MSVGDIISHFSSSSVLIPLSLMLIHWKKLSNEMRMLLWTLLVSLLADAASLILIMYSMQTHLVGNIYLVTQFTVIILLYKKQLDAKKTTDIILYLFLIFAAVNFFFFQGPRVFNSVTNVLECLILITVSLYYFYRLLNDLPTVHIHKLPMLWISFAVLTYYAGNFFLFLVGNYLLGEGREASFDMVWNLHNLLNIIKNILFTVALWQGYRKTRLSSLSSSAP